MPITEVFSQKGERFFRHEESSLLRNIPALLPEGSSAVVSCGGGIVLEPENRDLLRSTGTVFLLEVSPESVLERTAADNSRPLLIGRSPDEIRGMMAERGALYVEVSDHTIRTDGKTPPEIASEIISLL